MRPWLGDSNPGRAKGCRATSGGFPNAYSAERRFAHGRHKAARCDPSLCESGINTLVHFTRLEKPGGHPDRRDSPRSALETRAERVVFNDGIRIDGHKDAVCLSMGFPNYKMFYKYRKADQAATWAVLTIRADVLWEQDCAFCWANAACSAINRQSLVVLKDSSSLAKMFADQCEITGINRAECGIPDWFPTNPQAEVLAFSGVPLSQITTVYFQGQGRGPNPRRTLMREATTKCGEMLPKRGQVNHGKTPHLRPVLSGPPFMEEVVLDFDWHPGFAKSQSQKS